MLHQRIRYEARGPPQLCNNPRTWSPGRSIASGINVAHPKAVKLRAVVAGGGFVVASIAVAVRYPGVFHLRALLASGELAVVNGRVARRTERRNKSGTLAAEDHAPATLYDRYFSVVPATSFRLLDAAHALRYQVYCVERAYEDCSHQRAQREMDAYDSHSVHAVLIYRVTGNVVGCVRLILPRAQEGLSSLPIRALLDQNSRAILDQYDPGRTAEVSRYAVSKMFRHREGDNLYPDLQSMDRGARDFRRLVPHLSLGLLRGVAILAAERGIRTICAAIAPSLLRSLRRWGLNFEPLGPLVEYHGLRQPCIADCERLLSGMAACHVEYYRLIDAAYHRGLVAPS
jgi:N-acyl amino acid synthase of PEP-CTERM/exosortase system